MHRLFEAKFDHSIIKVISTKNNGIVVNDCFREKYYIFKQNNLKKLYSYDVKDLERLEGELKTLPFNKKEVFSNLIFAKMREEKYIYTLIVNGKGYRTYNKNWISKFGFAYCKKTLAICIYHKGKFSIEFISV